MSWQTKVGKKKYCCHENLDILDELFVEIPLKWNNADFSVSCKDCSSLIDKSSFDFMYRNAYQHTEKQVFIYLHFFGE